MYTYEKETLLDKKNLVHINPLRYGEMVSDSTHTYGPYTRAYYLLHYVISGKGYYDTPAGVFEVAAGQIFVIYPGEATTYSANKSDPWHYMWVGFESSLDLSDALSSYVIDAPKCADVFKSLIRDIDSVPNKEWFVCGKIYEVLSLMDEHQPGLGANNSKARIRIAQNYIAAHYHEELKVEAIAGKLNLNRTYFSKIFRKYTGKTPRRFIVDLRLDKAADLLLLQGFTPGEAAEKVGYTEISNFSRMFKRKFGLSPNQYRAKEQGAKT